ncbi:Putative inorganic phosphate cotransporter [Araneus ventricosus]|uniref:Inorganic phosphate cotransporter n=1 Tax=Araneus ventricosus TaxID=182803 RepID=A0A4Y2GWZ9_ARAVE|nr:Putative inorganic phosphate cotransporter [Araneus ventricosus]
MDGQDIHPKVLGQQPQKYSQLRVPWLSIFSSIPLWALVLAFMGAFFTDTITYTELPSYLSSALHVDVKNAGLYSSLPNIAICIGSWVSSCIADKLRKGGVLSITNIRKIFNSLAGYVLALCLIGIPFCGCRAWLVVVIYSFGMFVNGFKFSGFQLSSVDMSPTYSGIIYGIANGGGAVLGIAAPIMVGALTESGATIANWSKVFYVAAVILAVTTTVFALFSSAEVQPWGNPDCELESKGTEIVEQRQNSKSYINPIN